MTAQRFDQPLIAIDVAPIAFSAEHGLRTGLARRQFEPFAGVAALPGVLLGSQELLQDAATRALRTKAGIAASEVRHLMQLGAFDRPDRDPRSQAISIAFVAIVDPAAQSDAQWFGSADPFDGLPFDHGDIAREALAALRVRLWHDDALTRALTGDEFASTTAAALTEAVTGSRPHPGSLRRSLLENPRIERLDDTLVAHRGRPATMWRWKPPT